MNARIVTVFGGTGFLGRRVVRHLHQHGFSVRIASRHPSRARRLHSRGDHPGFQSVEADIHDERSVIDAVAGAYGVINAVSLYIEHREESFHSVHVECAGRLAMLADRAGVERLAHVSGIGSDSASPSRYIRKRGEGELAVRAGFRNATLIRPAVMFGPDDVFLSTIVNLVDRLPVIPMFGAGRTRLQPVYVEDVAEAIAQVMRKDHLVSRIFECAGPRTYSYEQLLRTVAREAGRKPILVPTPFLAWHAMAAIAEFLPNPPLARQQVELMQVDNVASPERPGLGELGVLPHSIEGTLQELLWEH